MKFLKYLLWIFLGLIGLFAAFLIFATIDNYSPDKEELVYENKDALKLNDSIYSIVTWNIGYAGLDSTMDFFYDGGDMVRPEKEKSRSNLIGILKTAESFTGTDFILLQEVDKKSKRSYKTDIYDKLSKLFPGYTSTFAKNYDVTFVPLPPSEPMGKVVSGLQTISATAPALSTRYSFPGNYSWPMSVFMLDRCFLMNHYPLENGKELIIINTHNSAYDDGSLRDEQMNYLKDFLLTAYNEGNYVLVGGDWNQSPHGFEPRLEPEIFDEVDLVYIDEDYPAKGWKWAYDASIPTNRRVATPYVSGQSPTTVIDFFLLSPNLEIIDAHGEDLDFAFSDHQPVYLTFKLK